MTVSRKCICMKPLSQLVLLLFAVNYSSFCQLPDSVIIRYDQGHYHFGHSGRYGAAEMIRFYRQQDSSYRLVQHIMIGKHFDSATERSWCDTLRFNVSRIVTASAIKKLLTELNTNRDNYTADYVRTFLKRPSKKKIIDVAKRNDLYFMWEESYSSEIRALYRAVKRFKKLDSLLSTYKPPLFEEEMVVLTDVWHQFNITVIAENKISEYRGQFVGILGQPVYRFDNGSLEKSQLTVNLEINNSIIKLVPSNSLVGNALDLNWVQEKYIKWYIDEMWW